MAQQPIIIAYHLVWTAYGCWLPNDPRGSGSREVRNAKVAELGEAHFGRKTIQPPGREIRQFYDDAVAVLRHPRLTFDAAAREEIGKAFDEVITAHRYTCYACAVMPDHIHLLLRKHKERAEEMVDVFRRASRDRLIAAELRSGDHPTWSEGTGRTVYLDHPDDVRRTIRYVEDNPVPLNMPVQRWPFVKAYDGWPLHPGHSPNSPYARRLRAANRYPH
jgi:REP element-mobilizing transposase RayT